MFGFNAKTAAAGTALALLAGNAAAAAIDVSTVTTAISDQLAPVGLIGVAVLGLLVAIKAYKWVRRAM
jgi:hypothetical protein